MPLGYLPRPPATGRSPPMKHHKPIPQLDAILVVACLAFALTARGCSDASRGRPGVTECHTGFAGTLSEVPEPYHIEITGSKHRWTVSYPDIDGRLAGPQTGAVVQGVHIPQETNVVLHLNSTDYVYNLTLPQLGLREIAVPGIEFRIELKVDHPGSLAIVGGELCGDPHPEMQGRLVVESKDHFLAWLRNRNSSTVAGTSF